MGEHHPPVVFSRRLCKKTQNVIHQKVCQDTHCNAENNHLVQHISEICTETPEKEEADRTVEPELDHQNLRPIGKVRHSFRPVLRKFLFGNLRRIFSIGMDQIINCLRMKLIIICSRTLLFAGRFFFFCHDVTPLWKCVLSTVF